MAKQEKHERLVSVVLFLTALAVSATLWINSAPHNFVQQISVSTSPDLPDVTYYRLPSKGAMLLTGIDVSLPKDEFKDLRTVNVQIGDYALTAAASQTRIVSSQSQFAVIALPPSLSTPRSRLPFFKKYINWPGDRPAILFLLAALPIGIASGALISGGYLGVAAIVRSRRRWRALVAGMAMAFGPADKPLRFDETLSAYRKTPVHWLVVMTTVASIAAVIALRIHWIALPFERDEGEYAYIGQQILRGVAPFDAGYTMKLPGTASMYALFEAIGGQSVISVRAGMIAVNLATCFAIWLIGIRLLSRSAAALAASFYAMTSLSISVLGLAAHATQFVAMFVCYGYYALLCAIDRRSHRTFALAGLLLGVSFLMKQSAAPFIVFGMIYGIACVCREAHPWRAAATRLAALCIGASLPYCLLLLSALTSPERSAFLLWTVQYAREYASSTSLPLGLNRANASVNHLYQSIWPVMLMSFVGVIQINQQSYERSRRLFLVGFLCASVVSVSLDMFFRPHYFVLLLPVLALLAAFAIDHLSLAFYKRGKNVARIYEVGLAAAALTLFTVASPIMGVSADGLMESTYSGSPFTIAQAIARYIDQRTSPGDSIGMLGSEPEIFYYAQRRMAAKNLYQYPLFEHHPVQPRLIRTFIAQTEAAHPRYYLRLVGLTDDFNDGMPGSLATWEQSYLQRNYKLDSIWLALPSGKALRLSPDQRLAPDSMSIGQYAAFWRRADMPGYGRNAVRGIFTSQPECVLALLYRNDSDQPALASRPEASQSPAAHAGYLPVEERLLFSEGRRRFLRGVHL